MVVTVKIQTGKVPVDEFHVFQMQRRQRDIGMLHEILTLLNACEKSGGHITGRRQAELSNAAPDVQYPGIVHRGKILHYTLRYVQRGPVLRSELPDGYRIQIVELLIGEQRLDHN